MVLDALGDGYGLILGHDDVGTGRLASSAAPPSTVFAGAVGGAITQRSGVVA